MRILLVCEAFRAFGGVREVVDSLAGEFLRGGHQVAVASTPAPYREDRPVRAAVECFPVPVPRWKPLKWRHPERLFKRPDVSALTRLIGEWRAEIVNLHGGVWERFPSFIQAGRAAHTPVIISLHGITYRGTAGVDALRWLKRAATITAISDSVRRNFAALEPIVEAAHVIRNGVDREAIQAAPRFERARPYILCVARLYLAEKAIDTLIEGFGLIAKEYPTIDLVIAGDGPDRGVIEKLVAKLDLGNRVELIGLRPQHELWGLYKGALLFAMPSRAQEGLGMVFFEAMAAGVPAIGTRIGGVPEVLIDGMSGLLIEKNDPAEIAERMRLLLSDAPRREQMSRMARELAMQFTWPSVAARYLEVYAKALSAG